MPSLNTRRVMLGLLAFAALGAGAASSGGSAVAPVATACPPGYHVIGSGERWKGAGSDLYAALADASSAADGCVSNRAPESRAELMAANAHQSVRRTAPYNEVQPGAYAAAVEQRRVVARTAADVPGTAGVWKPLGTSPLNNAHPDYPEVNGLGLADVAGRVQDFAWDPVTKTAYAAIAQGGVYKTNDLGDTWVSIGDRLPTSMVASVAYSPVNGGTVLVVTGDSAPGGSSLAGLGAFTTTDDGRTWVKAAGVPDGYLGFRAAVDPTRPEVMYAATGAGLWRSTDAGRTFVDVVLPTADCAGIYVYPCGLANHVTDVVVQQTTGAVMAAVGWRAGQKPYTDSQLPQAPANGIYVSDNGDPGSFTFPTLQPAGGNQQDRIGRVELGAATGVDQNHDYVYAIVQDAVKFNDGTPAISIEPAEGQVPVHNTALEGLYVSPDFGQTWVLVASGDELAQAACAAGSSLCGLGQATFFAPGVQAWYNMWIRPDPSPSRTVGGVPTRLLFGLEEMWSNVTTNLPVTGPTQFTVLGRYFSDQTCLILNASLPACPFHGVAQGGTTTHPDQHGGIFIEGPDEGQITLLVGNDGGVYRQQVADGEEFSQLEWGIGNQVGFHTLLPYDAKMAKDGVVWAGLQDNGHMRINLDGTQVATFGGDGTFAAVDPLDSDVAYEAYVGGAMSVTSDGGKTWTSIDPTLANPGFAVPFAMDPKDTDHLVTAGRDVKENLSGTAADWVTVFDLGTADNPGVPPEEPIPNPAPVPIPGTGPQGVQNRMSAIDVDGNALYVGYCGYCDVLTQNIPFNNGIATNVGGDAPPEAGTDSGWHIAAAAGLPNRYVTSVAIDPVDAKTVYVTLGGYGRRWAPPKLIVQDPEDVGVGHVFKSTDAGESFTDISANLPDVTANWVEVRGGQLLVATDFGVFISRTKSGGEYGLLGGEFGLPMAPVFTIQLKPGDSNTLVAATYGRGVYTYTFGASAPQPAPEPLPPPKPRPGPKPGGSPLPATGLPLLAGTLAAASVAAYALRRRRAAAAA